MDKYIIDFEGNLSDIFKQLAERHCPAAELTVTNRGGGIKVLVPVSFTELKKIHGSEAVYSFSAFIRGAGSVHLINNDGEKVSYDVETPITGIISDLGSSLIEISTAYRHDGWDYDPQQKLREYRRMITKPSMSTTMFKTVFA